jgi:hypothetical protein
VLPFANLSRDPEQGYFVDRITESLTTDLSRINGSFVIARNSAFSYQGKVSDVRQVGQELNIPSSSMPKQANSFGPSGSRNPSPIFSRCRTKSYLGLLAR